jgi:hypothetical protein
MATVLGVVMLRTSAAVEPVASASAAELTNALTQIFRTLLPERDGA